MNDAPEEVREDLGTIGLTPDGRQALETLMTRKWFGTEAAAFRAAVAYAIANDIKPTETGPFDTKWNIGTLDSRGEFIGVIELVVGTSRPWDRCRRLGDAGLRAMAERAEVVELPTELLLGRNE